MQDWLVPYATTIAAMGAMGALLLVQLIVADVAGIRAGHVPGTAVGGGHESFLFRATRAHANTNESLAAFALLALYGILNGASPAWLNGAAALFVAARVAHTCCYWADLRMPRSLAFVGAFVALIVMLVAGVGAGFR